MISFTSLMTNFNCDTYTGATPLAALKAGEQVDVMDMIIGRTAGTIGETSMVALIIGACILILLGVIDLKVPGSYIVTFVIFIAIFGGHGFDSQYISANLAGGGLMLGAFFMATDCDQTDYEERAVSLRYFPWNHDGNIPSIRTFRRGGILCNHPWQPVSSID